MVAAWYLLDTSISAKYQWTSMKLAMRSDGHVDRRFHKSQRTSQLMVVAGD